MSALNTRCRGQRVKPSSRAEQVEQLCLCYSDKARKCSNGLRLGQTGAEMKAKLAY